MLFDSINHIPLVRTSSKIITDSSKTVAPKLISFPTDTAYKGYIGLIAYIIVMILHTLESTPFFFIISIAYAATKDIYNICNSKYSATPKVAEPILDPIHTKKPIKKV